MVEDDGRESGTMEKAEGSGVPVHALGDTI
jgi:hypothetical protein